MRRARLAGLALALPLGLGSAAHAVALPFHATLTLQVGLYSTITASASGSGVGDSGGASGTATIPADTFSLQSTGPLAQPILSILFGYAIAAPGQGGLPPYAAGSNGALAFNGSTGTMGLNASAYLRNKAGKAVAALPLDRVGVGGTALFTVIAIPFSIQANPYQLGMVTVSGAIQSGAPAILMGTGFDARTTGGLGTLQLVTPARFNAATLGSIPVLSTLSITYTPEPGTIVLLGAGLAAIATRRRRRAG